MEKNIKSKRKKLFNIIFDPKVVKSCRVSRLGNSISLEKKERKKEKDCW